ncbi:hypothetical protein [Fusobacterium hwasookii]|uniref:Lipoprotein n=1 Tax=Fusobacterium hwasookii ChDC F206 TaxID=1307443 RepID=A0AAC8WJ07_9FUSO|nr:hypothetical protein [Fusobacterium hwasookii]ALQ35065.1 hypothetical protein RN92_03830 [Fusobacterium hwasookii ChDC F206]
MKKYLILFLSILIFSSCTRLAINTANSKAAKNEFYQGILELDNSMRKDIENKELFEIYQNIFNKGENYYNSTSEIRELFLMEKLYLDLPDNIKQRLPGIYVDINKHKKNGEKVASDLLKNTQLMGENSYQEKIKKYKQYKKVLTYNPNEKNKVENELKKLDKKLEKTYSYRINGNDAVLNSEIENKFSQEIKNNIFRYSSTNSDVILEINVKILYFYPEDVNMQSFPKQYTENYKDSNGKDNINIVSYSENIYRKSTSMGVRLNYRLISNLTGEVIFNGSKDFEKRYDEKWKTYYIISNKVFNKDKLPKDENEKSVPSRKKMTEDITKEILNTIDTDFQGLPRI